MLASGYRLPRQGVALPRKLGKLIPSSSNSYYRELKKKRGNKIKKEMIKFIEPDFDI